jgi:predicted amidophosphoribosyltransferase
MNEPDNKCSQCRIRDQVIGGAGLCWQCWDSINSERNKQREAEVLRDQIAMAALTGILFQYNGPTYRYAEDAADCYRWADAMLAAKEANRAVVNEGK